MVEKADLARLTPLCVKVNDDGCITVSLTGIRMISHGEES